MSPAPRSLLVAVLLSAALAHGASAAESTNRVISFSLEDQFNHAMTLQAPFTKPVLVTIADKEGATQLEAWLAPLKKEFPAQLEYFAIADLRAVPRPLRGLVRRGFRKEYSHPVALDWEGSAAGQVSLVKDRATLLLLDHQGRELLVVGGQATGPELDKLRHAIRHSQKFTGSPIDFGSPAQKPALTATPHVSNQPDNQ
jgi:hypothetical protein